MLLDQGASLFLSHEEVKNRLYGSMQRWIANLFAADADELQGLVARQMQIGDIHARI